MRFSEHYWRYRRELPDRARITLPMCERAVTEAVEMEEQPDGRTVYWHYVEDEGR